MEKNDELAAEKVKEEEFERKTQERLDKSNGIDSTPNEDLKTETDTETDSTPIVPTETPAEPDEDSTPIVPDETPAETEIETDTETKSEPAESQLPEAYYRAALHQEWTPDEIAEFYKETPELALRTFKKMYDSVNRSSRDFAAIGRAQTKNVEASKKVIQPEESAIKKIDLAKLREKYPEDDIVDVLEQIQNQNVELATRLQQQPAQQQQMIDEQQVRREIEDNKRTEDKIVAYFASEDLKPYKDFYGFLIKEPRTWYDGLTETQKEHRFNVVVEADYILQGARASGIEVSVDDAMSRAHLIVSEPIREQILRDNLKKKAMTKQKGITLKPNSKVRSPEGKVHTKDEFVNATAQRMRKAGL